MRQAILGIFALIGMATTITVFGYVAGDLLVRWVKR